MRQETGLVFTRPQIHYMDQFPESLKPASKKGIAVILIFPKQERDQKGVAGSRSQNKPDAKCKPNNFDFKTLVLSTPLAAK